MLTRFTLSLALLLASPVMAQDQTAPAMTEVVMQTSRGPITIALETDRAPVTAGNFLAYVDAGKFDGTVFYRAMRLEWGEQPNGLIQGGTQNDPDRLLPPVAHERTSDTGVLHGTGAISMARLAPGTATGDFSIMVSPQPGLDADPASDDPDRREGYAAFGHVTAGMDVVRQIFDAPLDPDKGEGWLKGQMLAEPVRIISVDRVSPQED
ncbi:peptidylprolyl isomerase [Croceibacterium mercuriale]|uniref:peptidylprolyl isomerase n=1 Tax=Croceibacterium mercuriale TaxID=1572751 RepID=A0A0B2C136_9SPHN|nr:peptidylprolyl isomerase [Croceibacterium mercuriale]KHL25671.1 peptidylprolyl isomerase [Croceibacterium mercuriale]